MSGIFLILQLQLLFVISFCHGLTVTSVTESTITLTWPAGDYENFTIFYSGEDGLNHTTTVSEWSGDNATAVIDDHLEAGQLYTIDIRGHTLSDDTFSVVQVFSQATKPNPPSNVTVTSAETDSMKAVWFEENDAVSSYVVRYKDLSNDSALMVESSVNDTSLSLPQLQPGHTYSIRIAAVYFGVESNQTTPITDNTVPLPPEKVSVQALNETALYVMWEPDSSSIQENFSVSYQADGGAEIPVTCVNDPSTECTLLTAGDPPGQLYNVNVRSVQGQRTSSAKSVLANTKPLAVEDLKPVNITTQSIQVSWLVGSGSKQTGFLVTLDPPDSSQSSQNKTDLNAVFDGLTSGQTYQITVLTWAGQEKSDPRADVFWTVPTSPNPRSQSSNQTIVLTWDSPAGQRDNYSISVTEDSSGVSKTQVVAGTAVSGEVSGLRAGSTYTFTVTANSGNQKSKPAILSSVTTVPNEVEDLKVSVTDLQYVLVMWRRPTSSVVEEYKVTVTENPGLTRYVSSQEEYISYNISGLEAGTQYTVSVRSVSGGGSKESPASTLTISTIPASVESLDVTANTDSIQVNWSLSADINYDFLNISLSNDTGEVESVSRHKSSPDAPNHTFFNLESGSLYMVTIVTSLTNGIVGRPINTTAITEPVPIKGIAFLDEPRSYSLAFSWTVHPAEAHGYLVTVADLSNASIPRYEETVTGKDANVTGLYPGHHYEVGVRAFVNYTGTIVYSDRVAENTTTKPLAVLKLAWTTGLSGKIFVSWQASAEAQSRHDTFEYRYRSVLRNPNSVWITNDSTQSDTVIDVFPGERYEVEVWTRAGDIASEVEETSAIIAPRAPQSVLVITDKTSTDSLYVDLQVDEHLSYATHWNFTLTPNTTSFPVVTKSVSHPFVNLTEIAGLRSGETYTIDVYSVTVGEMKSESSVATSGTVRPVLDTELTESNVTNSTLTLTYIENSPVFDNYYFQLGADKPVVRSASEPRKLHLQDLMGGQTVTITAWVSSSGVTSEQKTYQFQTEPNTVLTEFVVDATEIRVLLIKPEGNVDYYNVTCFNGPNMCGFYHLNASENQQEVSFTDLTAYQDYSFTIVTVSGKKHVTKDYSKQTAQSAPSVVRKVSAIVLSPNTVQVRWERPELSNGDITKYQVRYVGKLQGKPNDEKTRWLSGWEVPPTNVTLPNLLAGYSYTFYVSAYTVSLGPAGDATLTVAAYPPPFKDSLKTEDLLPTTVEEPSPTTATLKFVNAFSQKGGEVIAYTIIVSTDNSTEQKMPIVLPGWQTAQNDPAIKAYQAIANCTDFFSETRNCRTPAGRKLRSANEQSEFTVFTIGMEKDCEQKVYCNGPLKPDTEYYIALRAFTAGGPSDTPYSKKIRTAAIPVESDPGPVIGGVVAGVLIIVILVLAVVLYRHWQRRPNMYKKEDHELHEDLRVKRNSSRRTKTSRIVKLTDFPDHFMLMSADSDYRFAEEFEELRDVGREQPCNAAELPQNRAKNRFTNILPYDHSRVKLLPTDDEEGSDYINANYMPGYNSRREYIVTQGPLHSTRDDFWRLLWEQNARNIIMLTRCVEKGREKCDHYWPQNSETMFYGDLQVAILNETKFPDWTITEFRVSLGDNSRKVRHFHYTAWPDFGVPERPLSLVKFVTTVREKMIAEGGPHIVHCSAGVGRSGTFIALDRLLQHIQSNDWVDPYGIVYEMRCQRVWMVQTEQQYICIHQCLLSVLQGFEEEPVYCNQAHDNVGFEDDEGINVEIM